MYKNVIKISEKKVYRPIIYKDWYLILRMSNINNR